MNAHFFDRVSVLGTFDGRSFHAGVSVIATDWLVRSAILVESREIAGSVSFRWSFGKEGEGAHGDGLEDANGLGDGNQGAEQRLGPRGQRPPASSQSSCALSARSRKIWSEANTLRGTTWAADSPSSSSSTSPSTTTPLTWSQLRSISPRSDR